MAKKLTQLSEASNVQNGDFIAISELQNDLVSFISKKVEYSNVVSSISVGLSNTYSLLNGSNDLGVSFTYNGDGTLNTKTINGITMTYTYNIDGTIATKTDGVSTWTYNYTDSQLTSKVKT